MTCSSHQPSWPKARGGGNIWCPTDSPPPAINYVKFHPSGQRSFCWKPNAAEQKQHCMQSTWVGMEINASSSRTPLTGSKGVEAEKKGVGICRAVRPGSALWRKQSVCFRGSVMFSTFAFYVLPFLLSFPLLPSAINSCHFQSDKLRVLFLEKHMGLAVIRKKNKIVAFCPNS